MKSHKQPNGITSPKGILAAGMHSGIKQASGLDLALVYSEQPGPIAGTLTTNRIKAAPIVLTQRQLRKSKGQAFIINSGNANAFTGVQGFTDAQAMARTASSALGIPVSHVYVGSTGVIGRPLPIKKIDAAIPRLVTKLRRSGHLEAAKAIMTTDTYPKEAAFKTKIGGQIVTVGGMAKGSGMIHPNMATMLAYLTTDANISPAALRLALTTTVNQSFNCITVDGDTSTNDAVLCLSNGKAENTLILPHTPQWKIFQALLKEVCLALAMQICRDGEGCTKLVEIVVRGTKSVKGAKQIAETVATSLLVKTALFGEDPNWGRIIAAAGRAGVPFSPDSLELRFDDIAVVKSGQRMGPQADRQAKRILRKQNFTVTLFVGSHGHSHRLWTTDLSYEYVRINASYTT